jgi:hypothetical protein
MPPSTWSVAPVMNAASAAARNATALATGDLRAVRLGPGGLWLEWALATRAETPEPALAAFLDALRAHHPRAHASRTRTARGARRPGSRASG